MMKFNKLFKADCTSVLINGDWYLVKAIDESKKLISVHGLIGGFQRGHVSQFTNKHKAQQG